MKKILILITHSLGEFDVVFPLIAQAQSERKCQFTIVITVRTIYLQFTDSRFYRYCADDLNVDVQFCQLPNKFDIGFKLLRRCLRAKFLVGLVYDFLLIAKGLAISRSLFEADYFMHEVTNQWSTTKILYWFDKKNIFSYMHGHGITSDTIFKQKVKHARDVTYLNFHEDNRCAIKKMGFVNQEIIGYPKLMPGWKKLVQLYPADSSLTTGAVVIFTRPANKYYMTESNYRRLLSTAYHAIRKTLGLVPILIKNHPREDSGKALDLFHEFSFDSAVTISHEHAAVLSRDALVTLIFWGSTIFDGLSMGKPAIEYYLEGPLFRQTEPCGSAYKKAGFHSVASQAELELALEDVARGTYRESRKLERLNKPTLGNIFGGATRTGNES